MTGFIIALQRQQDLAGMRARHMGVRGVDLRQRIGLLDDRLEFAALDQRPPGFAHGFLVLSKSADVLYKTTDFYSAPSERTIRWNDPTLAIAWPLSAEPSVSAKDAEGTALHQTELPNS
mgnify:CR=1 FL=1